MLYSCLLLFTVRLEMLRVICSVCDCYRPMLMDLIIAFVPYLSYDSLCILFELVKGLLEVHQNVKF